MELEEFLRGVKDIINREDGVTVSLTYENDFRELADFIYANGGECTVKVSDFNRETFEFNQAEMAISFNGVPAISYSTEVE